MTASEENAAVDAAVAKGAALLDANVPDWRSRVDVDDLNMVSGALCVLGQVFDGYTDGLMALWEDTVPNVTAAYPLAIEHGFDTEGDYDQLREVWTEEILTRS